MNTVILRILISVIAIIASMATAYVAVWDGLGRNNLLSSENAAYSIRIGTEFGIFLTLVINCLRLPTTRRTAWINFGIIAGLLSVWGFCMSVWTACIASC